MTNINNRQRLGVAILFFLSVAGSSATPATNMAGDTQDSGVYSALSLGTAWAVTRQHVVTNYHVVANTRNLRLVMPGQHEIPLKLIASDPQNDLAILALAGTHRLNSPLPVSHRVPGLGSAVFTIGYPHPDLMGTSPKLTAGHINALSGIADDPRIFQVDVPVQAGNSGGPLLNMYGEVVAIITSKLNAIKLFERTGDVPQNVNYAIKIDRLIALLEKSNIRPAAKRTRFDTRQSLESLAGQSLDSILIIAGDAPGRKTDKAAVSFSVSPKDKTEKTPRPEKVTNYVIYSYAEPGAYDIRESINGSSTTFDYSKNTAKLINTHLNNLHDNIKITSASGRAIRHVYHALDDDEQSKYYCQKDNADKIFSSLSEINSGGVHFRYVHFKVLDCKTMRLYRHKYTIERDEQNDSFGYEMALHNSFKDFLFKIPPFIAMGN